MLLPCCLILLSFLLCGVCGAQWPEHLRTGRLMNMSVDYGTHTPERLDALVRMRGRFVLGGAAWVAGWSVPGDGALSAYHERGLKVIAYTAPHTIYGDDYFEKSGPYETVPRARDWLAVGVDGNPLRPWGTKEQRYLACINNPGWQAHCRDVILRLIQIGASGVFWDDAFPFGCYCTYCRNAFHKWLASRYTAAEIAQMGVTEDKLPPPPAVRMFDMHACKTLLDREWATFAEASLERFIGQLKETARALDPDFIFSANTSQPGVVSCMDLSEAVMDVWVYEEGPHSLAPQHNNALRYLQGFARAKRKPVEMIACGDGWGQEKATPVQYACSIAEGVACGGEFVLHMGHAGKDDEMWRVNPENERVITRYRAFFDAHEPLLENLRPAARVAIFDSAKSARFDTEYSRSLYHLADNLNWLGIPYTVISADATADLVSEFDAVLVNSAPVLSDAEVTALQKYRDAGGKLVVIKDAGSYTDRWEPRRYPPLGEPTFAEMPDAEELRAALWPVSDRGPRLRVPADAHVQLHAWEKTDEQGRVLVMHVLNYTVTADGEELTPVEGLRLELPTDAKITSLMWETPEGEVRHLVLRQADGVIMADLPRLAIYALITGR
jgi:hypothetical protein